MATMTILFILLFGGWTCAANKIQNSNPTSSPSISFYPCEIPIQGNIKFCCVTENIHTATVYFYRETGDIITVKHPCDVDNKLVSMYNVTCQSDGPRTVMSLRVLGYYPSHIQTYGCRFYGKASQYKLYPSQVLTKNNGYQYVNITKNATLKWPRYNSGESFFIYNPQGQIIIDGSSTSNPPQFDSTKYAVDFGPDTFLLKILHVTKDQNGTYVYATQNNMEKRGITLVVLDKLDKPVIHNVSTSLSSGKIKANMTCTSPQKSGAPLFYQPVFDVLWKYPSQASYTVVQNGSNLILDNVDCSSDKSQPIFCSIREENGPYSEVQHYYPHDLCSYKTAPAPPPKEEKNTTGLVAGVIILALLSGFLLVVAYYGKHQVARCCSKTCRRSKICCRVCVCGRCIKEDLDFDIADEPRFQIPISDFGTHEEVDWRRILDLYSGETPPTVPPPRSILPIPRPDLYPPPRSEQSLQSSSDNTGQLENDESGIDNPDFQDDESTINDDDLTVSEISTLGATGVDHATLVKEVETCLTDLKKLLNSSENQVQVRREHIVEDLMNIYTDPTILQSYLHINVLGEPGSDWGGVSRDIFTSFWNEVTVKYFKGHDVHVPYLPPHKMEEERNFLLMGRILAHSTAILGYIPISICKSCMMVTIYNTTHIESNTLLEDFLLFVDLKERNLIQEALNDFSALSENQQEELQDLFYQFEMGCILKEETFRDQLLNMARNELCLKPRSLCEKLRQGIPEVHFAHFWSQMTIDHIGIFHARLKPTPEKVIKCLKLAEPLRLLDMRRRKVFQYFKDFIEQLNDEDLQKLIQFITGQTCVPKRNISVQFSNLSGAERRPVAHTCGYLIELPEAYDSYSDFETEFTNVLRSDILRFDVQ